MTKGSTTGVLKGPAPAPERLGISDARQRLLTAASDLMCENDKVDVSFRELAARTSLNSGLIKYYFGNKDRLLLETLENDILPVIAELSAVRDLDLSATERLRMQIAVMVTALHRFPYVNRLLMVMLRDYAPEHGRRITEDLSVPLYGAVSEVMDEGIASGEFRPLDVKFMFWMLTGACTQIFSSRAAMGYMFERAELDRADRDRYARQIMEIFIGGMAAAG